MKKTLFTFIFLFLFSGLVLAEEGAKLKSVEVSFGDSAFTSGLNVSTLFSLNQKTDLEVVGNSERFYITSNFKVGDKLSLDATGGVFKKLPWVGPRVTYYPMKRLMLLYWGGWSSGRVGELRPEVKSFCQQLSAYVTPVKNVSVGYNIVKLDAYKTTQLPEIAYRYEIQENLRLGASATYDTLARKPLFCVSLKYILR
jgi:hypothetical protein